MKRAVAVFLLCSFLSFGCGSDSQTPSENIKLQAQGKLDAMKLLADSLEKKDTQQVSGAIEAIVSGHLDVATYPDMAKEFLEIYNKRVKGKLRGDEAAQIKNAVDEVEKALKPK